MSLTELLDAPSGSTAAAVDATVDTALDAPHAGQPIGVRSPRVFDLSGGRCAVEVILAPLGIAAWRVRLQPASIRIVADATGGAELTAHVSARPKFASLPGTAGLFMPATARSTILAVTASLPSLAEDAAVVASGVVSRGADQWPIELVVDVRELDDEHVVAAINGVVHRRDDLPMPGIRLRIDAALDLRRCA